MELLILVVIFISYLRPGFVDHYIKERYIINLGWDNLPDFLHHKPAFKQVWPFGWHIVIQSESIINLILFSFILNDARVLFGILILWTEDLYYYLFTWMRYKKPMPENLGWLNPFSEKFPKKYFITIYIVLLFITVFFINITA